MRFRPPPPPPPPPTNAGIDAFLVLAVASTLAAILVATALIIWSLRRPKAADQAKNTAAKTAAAVRYSTAAAAAVRAHRAADAARPAIGGHDGPQSEQHEEHHHRKT